MRLALEEPWQDYEDALRGEEQEEKEDHMHRVVFADQLEQISDHGDNNDRDWRDLDSDMDSLDKAVAETKTRIDAWERSTSALHSPKGRCPHKALNSSSFLCVTMCKNILSTR